MGEWLYKGWRGWVSLWSGHWEHVFLKYPSCQPAVPPCQEHSWLPAINTHKYLLPQTINLYYFSAGALDPLWGCINVTKMQIRAAASRRRAGAVTASWQGPVLCSTKAARASLPCWLLFSSPFPPSSPFSIGSLSPSVMSASQQAVRDVQEGSHDNANFQTR